MEMHRYHDVNQRGTVERICYTTKEDDGTTVAKTANVYLPYGYIADQKYPVLYLIHGGGGSQDAWLDASQIKNALDTSFAENRCKPFITVFPCFYNHAPVRKGQVEENVERENVLRFQRELRNDLVPAVDSSFSTCSRREARAIGGFSMGGVTTWFAFQENLDLFSVFMPLSGDSWQFGGLAGGKVPEKTAGFLHDRVTEQGFGRGDFSIYAGTGYEDIAYPNLTPQIEAMKKLEDLFDFSDALEKGNLHYVLMENAPHMYEKVYQHVYSFLPFLFTGNKAV